jgi:hypothetical protein
MSIATDEWKDWPAADDETYRAFELRMFIWPEDALRRGAGVRMMPTRARTTQHRHATHRE